MTRLGIGLLVLGLLACKPAADRPLQTLKVTSPPLDPGPCLIDVGIPGGQLDVLGGGVDVVGGLLRFDHPEMEPVFKVAPDEARRGTRISLTTTWYPGIGPTTNLWTVTLPPDRPFDLDLRMGAGRVNLAPKGVTLASLTTQQNFGETLVDLSKTTWEGMLEVSIEVGSGPQARIVVPDGVGVTLHAIQSVGTVVAPSLTEQDDDTWVRAPALAEERTLDLSVRIGTGDVVVWTPEELAQEQEENQEG